MSVNSLTATKQARGRGALTFSVTQSGPSSQAVNVR